MDEMGGSLFEGMDFVLSEERSAEAAPETEITVSLSTNVEPHTALQSLPSGPLDENLFTGLSMLPFTESELGPGRSVDETLLADAPLKHGSTTAVFNSKSGRKKKRSLRIGYGREAADSEETVIEVDNNSSNNNSGKNFVDDVSYVIPELEADGLPSDDGFRISVSNSEVSRPETESDLTDVAEPDDQKEIEKVVLEGVDVLHASEKVVETVPEVEDAAETAEVVEVEVVEEKTSASDELDVSIEGRLGAIKREIARKLEQLEVEAAEASALRKVAAQVRREAAVLLSAAAAKRKDLEVELESACEREDFELADKLSEDVAAAEESLQLADVSFKEAEMKYDVAAANMEGILSRKIIIEDEGAVEMEKLQVEAEMEAERIKNEAAEAARSVTEKVAAKEEHLDVKNAEYLSQLQALEEAKVELDKAIGEATEPDVREKLSILAEREVLVDELQDLLDKVHAKELEIAMRDRSLEDISARIAGVSGNFQGNKISLETELQNVNSLLKELQTDRCGLEAAREEAEKRLALAEAECEDLKNTAGAAAAEALSLKAALERRRKVAAFSRDLKGKKTQLVKEEEELLTAAQALRHEATVARSSLQELSATKVRLQQDISAAKQKIAYLEKRGPELEGEKRLAAAARNFKEAARLSAEAKALLAEKEGATGELQKCNSELQKLEEDIEARIGALADVEGLIASKEKEAAKACCERLRLVAVAARDEKEVAMELNDFEEAESLEAEAAAADAEADELQRIHQLQGGQFQKLLQQEEVDERETV